MGARIEEYTSDEVIIKEGTRSNKMYIVLEGKVILYKNYGTADEYVIGACGHSKTFGEMNLFCEEPSIYTAVAFTDVKLAWFERNNLYSFIKSYPDSTQNLLENIAKSYSLLSKNLQMALEELNMLRNMQANSEALAAASADEEASSESSSSIPSDYTSIMTELESSIRDFETSSGYHSKAYTNNNRN